MFSSRNSPLVLVLLSLLSLVLLLSPTHADDFPGDGVFPPSDDGGVNPSPTPASAPACDDYDSPCAPSDQCLPHTTASKRFCRRKKDRGCRLIKCSCPTCSQTYSRCQYAFAECPVTCWNDRDRAVTACLKYARLGCVVSSCLTDSDTRIYGCVHSSRVTPSPSPRVPTSDHTREVFRCLHSIDYGLFYRIANYTWSNDFIVGARSLSSNPNTSHYYFMFPCDAPDSPSSSSRSCATSVGFYLNALGIRAHELRDACVFAGRDAFSAQNDVYDCAGTVFDDMLKQSDWTC